MLDLGKVAIKFATQLNQQTVVRKLERQLDRGDSCWGREGGDCQAMLRVGVAREQIVAMGASQRNSLWGLSSKFLYQVAAIA